MKAPALVLSLLAATGCLGAIDELDPEVGPPRVERCDDADSDPGRDVSYARDIAPLFTRAVAGCGCHLPTDPAPIGVAEAGLDLSSRAALLRGGARSGAAVVRPGKPCDSLLVQKLAEGPPVGSRMPFDGPPYLEAAELQLISDWIAEGALDD